MNGTTRTTNSLPQVWWKKIIQYLLHVAAFIVLLILLVFFIQALFPHPASAFWRDTFVPWCIFLMAAFVSVFIFDRLKVGARLQALSFVRERFLAGSWTGLWVGSSLILSTFLILWMGGWVAVTQIDFQFNLFMSWLLFFLIQPLAEELIMRTFLQSQTHYYFGSQAGLILTALVFGLLHADNDNFSWIAGLEIIAGGYLMGLLYLHTQSIWGPYLMHASWNFMQSTVLGFAVSGMETYHVLHLDINGPEWLTGGNFGIEGSILSLLLLLGAIGWFWSAGNQTLPLATPPPQLIRPEKLLDESDTL